jgi:hypothetical protein
MHCRHTIQHLQHQEVIHTVEIHKQSMKAMHLSLLSEALSLSWHRRVIRRMLCRGCNATSSTISYDSSQPCLTLTVGHLHRMPKVSTFRTCSTPLIGARSSSTALRLLRQLFLITCLEPTTAIVLNRNIMSPKPVAEGAVAQTLDLLLDVTSAARCDICC